MLANCLCVKLRCDSVHPSAAVCLICVLVATPGLLFLQLFAIIPIFCEVFQQLARSILYSHLNASFYSISSISSFGLPTVASSHFLDHHEFMMHFFVVEVFKLATNKYRALARQVHLRFLGFFTRVFCIYKNLNGFFCLYASQPC